MILKLENVSKSFGALKVTDAVTFAVPRGEALGIIGPNGAGKSTLFNLITGNLLADEGRIEFLGRDVTRAPAMERVRMGIGRSFQIPQPFEGLTVFENLLTAAAFGRGGREADMVDDCARILDETELLRKANAVAGALSLLDRKRLELARALATGPGTSAARRDRRRPDGRRVQGAGRDDPGDPCPGHDDHLDRACAACADIRSWSGCWCSISAASSASARRTRSWRRRRCSEIYLGIEV